MDHCPNCGTPVQERQRVCDECGINLPGREDPDQPQGQDPYRGQAQDQGSQGGQSQGQGGRPQGQGGQPQQGGRPQGQGGQPQQGGRPPGGQPPGGPQGGRGPEDGDQPGEGIDRRTLLAGGGVVAAVVAGGGLFVFLQGDDEDGSPDGSSETDVDGSPDTPGQSFAEAPQISSGTHGPYELAEGENHDFAIDLEAGDQLTVTASFTHAEGDLDLELYDSSELLARADSSTDDETLTREADASETHYITVYGYEGATNSYELDVQVT